jgi:hypothetical protein
MIPIEKPEEEPFAALIFPGFDSSAFIWQITCWQAEGIGKSGEIQGKHSLLMIGYDYPLLMNIKII